MGIETLLFISLAITFVMLIMLVYHFQNKFDTLEKRTSSLLEIINNIVKELREVKIHLSSQQQLCKNVCLEPETMHIDLGNSSNANNYEEVITLNEDISNDDDADNDADDDDNDDDLDNEGVSDEDDSEDEHEVENLDDKIVVSDTEEDIGEIVVHKLNTESSYTNTNTNTNTISNYKKMDIRQLRQIALEKGLIDETQKRKWRKIEMMELLEKM